jgi:FAD dependent oxidoreductase
VPVGEKQTDVLIVGGGVGGCAAALAIAEAGHRAILTEETDWIGGQFTSQGVPPDEHGWIERFGCTRTYRQFREEVRAFYRQNYPLTPCAREDRFLNPGNGWVSPLCHEPCVALTVLQSMLAPFINDGRLTLLLEHRPVAAEMAGRDSLRSVTFGDARTGDEQTISAKYFLDATELGDLLAITGTEYVTGAESQAQTGEPHAPGDAQPHHVQAFSICFAIDYLEGENHTIEKPARYDFWRSYVPRLEPPWPGPLLSWKGLNPRTLEPVRYNFNPHREDPVAFSGLWTYRRILDRGNFTGDAFRSDICLVNWPMNDYLLGDISDCSEEEKSVRINEAKEQSLSLLYWLQTAAPRPDGGAGWAGLRLRPDVVGTRDRLAKHPYIRESRRIKAEFTVLEEHVAADVRPESNYAVRFRDSVGIGYYRIDLHPSGGGDNYIDIASLPFEIPLGALIPVRMENLLPASKNIGTTHITNGCYRLHPVEWNIGEAAGSLAAYCMDRKISPRAVRNDRRRLEEFQQRLLKGGVELSWPDNLSLEEGDPHAHAKRK